MVSMPRRGFLLMLATMIGAAILLLALSNAREADAQAVESPCAEEPAAPTSDAAAADPLAGRLGGTREAFEARFGPATSEDKFSTTWTFAGCGDLLVNFDEGIVTDIDLYPPGFSIDAPGWWTLSQAEHIASKLLPTDVQISDPIRNVSFVEHQPCYSDALAQRVPATVYAYVDNNPTQGQCSAVYSLDDADDVQNFGVQLQIEDPN